MKRIYVFFLLFLGAIAKAASEFEDKRIEVDFNLFPANEIVNESGGRELVIRRKPKGIRRCDNPDDCPAAVIVSPDSGNVNIKGKTNVSALYVGGQPVINADGQWLGDNKNLRGSQGPEGPTGPQGEGCRVQDDSIICGGYKITVDSLKGPKGDTGEQGPQGPQGGRGAVGPRGSRGEVGNTGPAGPEGPRGIPGAGCKVESDSIVCGEFSIAVESLRGPAGKEGPKGDTGVSCRANDSGIQCGQYLIAIEKLKGPKGDRGEPGESCVQGASIYPGCLKGLTSQQLFVIVQSQQVRDDWDCKPEMGGLLKKFVGTCPASHPHAIAGSCEWRWNAENSSRDVSISASEPLSDGKGWQCEMTAQDANACFEASVRVWTTCTNVGSKGLN